MKVNKKAMLAAAAILSIAGAAQAQSTVSLYGLLDLSVGASKAQGSSSSVNNVASGNMSTSHFGVSGKEDLGGGMSASFALESFMRTDNGSAGRFNGDAYWARNAYVSLASKDLGDVKLGRNTTPLFVSTLIFNAFGDSFGYSPSIRHYYTSGTVSGDSGWNNSVLYTTPNMGGASVSLFAAPHEGTGDNSTGISALYFGGPLAATAVYQKVGKNTVGAVQATTTTQFGASYDLGAAKLFGQYGKIDNKTVINSYKITSFGIAVPVGAGKVIAEYSDMKPNTGAELKTFSFGYDYSLSKRSDLYAVYMNDAKTGVSTGTSYSVGLRHRF